MPNDTSSNNLPNNVKMCRQPAILLPSSASQIYVKMKFRTPTLKQRMNSAGLDKETISPIYSVSLQVTKDTRLAIFQFKFIHYILPTNATLFTDSLISSEQCHLCTDKQTLKHLFITCSDVLSFWTHFTSWWHEKNLGMITLSYTGIIYGFTNDLPLHLGFRNFGQIYIYTA